MTRAIITIKHATADTPPGVRMVATTNTTNLLPEGEYVAVPTREYFAMVQALEHAHTFLTAPLPWPEAVITLRNFIARALATNPPWDKP